MDIRDIVTEVYLRTTRTRPTGRRTAAQNLQVLVDSIGIEDGVRTNDISVPPGGSLAPFWMPFESLGNTANAELYSWGDEGTGALIVENDVFASDHLIAIGVEDLVPGQRFGTLVFDFANGGGGLVTAAYSAFGRFSVELNGACTSAPVR